MLLYGDYVVDEHIHFDRAMFSPEKRAGMKRYGLSTLFLSNNGDYG